MVSLVKEAVNFASNIENQALQMQTSGAYALSAAGGIQSTPIRNAAAPAKSTPQIGKLKTNATPRTTQFASLATLSERNSTGKKMASTFKPKLNTTIKLIQQSGVKLFRPGIKN